MCDKCHTEQAIMTGYTYIQESNAPQIDFDVDDRFFGVEERMSWWESTRPWFLERGYDLYYQVYYEFDGKPIDHIASTSPLSAPNVAVKHPYSFIGGDPSDCRSPVLNHLINGRIMCAQDSQHRQVAFKLMKINSEEHRILRALSQEPSLFSAEFFDCVIPPLDFLELEDHCFVVMPRWGDGALHPWFSTLGEVLDYMHCLLKVITSSRTHLECTLKMPSFKGLCFLHDRFIAHRDIKPSNVLINHIGRYEEVCRSPFRGRLRSQRHALYAIFDFDCSVMFPPTSTPSERRLRGRDSFIGGGNFAYDAAQGEIDYDPFAYDVGALGQLFCEWFQHLIPIAPMLAPFLDKMIAREVANRFTARQALHFFESFQSRLSLLQLDAAVSPPTQRNAETYDRWKGLPPDFIQKWCSYREPAIPWSTKVLRQICEHELGYSLVQWVRWIGQILLRPSITCFHGCHES